MGDAKRIRVEPISASDARRVVKALHYSGKCVNNSRVHLGVFLDGRCGGALQFGPSMDKRKMLTLVSGTRWNEFIELNRMALADWLPRNGESRVIGYAMRWLRRTYPWLQWVVSFADGTQCGDGTIYRASGFVLTGMSARGEMMRLPSGEVVHRLACNTSRSIVASGGGGKVGAKKRATQLNANRLRGYQLRYIYFLDPSARERLTVPVLPFSEIEVRGAGMYRGKPRERSRENAAALPSAEGGVIPTRSLQL